MLRRTTSSRCSSITSALNLLPSLLPSHRLLLLRCSASLISAYIRLSYQQRGVAWVQSLPAPTHEVCLHSLDEMKLGPFFTFVSEEKWKSNQRQNPIPMLTRKDFPAVKKYPCNCMGSPVSYNYVSRRGGIRASERSPRKNSSSPKLLPRAVSCHRPTRTSAQSGLMQQRCTSFIASSLSTGECPDSSRSVRARDQVVLTTQTETS
jgi:hypothetical protein